MPKRTDIHKILVIGSGPIVIGQAAEFDYSGTQACLALREEGYEVVLINSNPAQLHRLTKWYEGMIVGECAKDEDIVCNVCKKKHVTNTRASGSDEALKLVPPTTLSLEQSMEFLADDELLEVTPKSIRLRKTILDKSLRLKAESRKK